ncbi:MAG: bifunctional 4-hydroxy-3-methylbut-2-enyl diphosphate reductase/30S ribosomal protein S1 [Moorellales bacterium]
MEIRVAPHAGFCPGVRRAIRLVEAELAKEKGPLYSLGPLVHNRQAVAWLQEQGLKSVDRPEEIPWGRVVIRSHGVAPEVIAQLETRGLEVVDATCPLVRRVQIRAHELAQQGYRVVVVGEKNHPEVLGVVGWAGPGTIVVENVSEAGKLPPMQKVGVVAQTTQPVDRFRQVAEVLREKASEVVVEETICQTTRQRQEAARRLAREVDVMVVVGSADSANTNRLAEICRASGTPTYRIEEADELCPQWLARASRVGVTAGASTPDWIIEEVVRKMWEIEENKEQQNAPVEAANAEVRPEPQEEPSSPEEQAIGTPEAAPVAEAQGVEEGAAPPDAGESGEGQAPVRTPEADGENVGLEQAMVSSFSLRRGDIIKGTVVQINNGEVLVDVGAKSEGIIPLSELSYRRIERPDEVVKVGDEIEVYVIRPENEEGHPILSKRRADRKRAWEKLEQAYETGGVIEAQASEVVKGGLLVDLGVRGFVPASLVGRGYVEDLSSFVGQTLRLKVIELDRNKNKVVLSQKAVLEEEYQRQRAETWASLAEGQVRKGVVRRLTNFGAFVDLGGVDGLLHVSEISWGRVEHPRDVLEEGQEIEVKVLGVDRERERVSLGLKQLQPNPWDTAAERYPVGTIVNGKVLRLTSFGAFVEVEPGIEGLVHISQLADRRVEKPEEVVKVGDVIPVKVLAVDQTAQRMSLSLKQAQRETSRRPAAREEAETNSGGVTIGELVGNLFEEHR